MELPADQGHGCTRTGRIFTDFIRIHPFFPCLSVSPRIEQQHAKGNFKERVSGTQPLIGEMRMSRTRRLGSTLLLLSAFVLASAGHSLSALAQDPKAADKIEDLVTVEFGKKEYNFTLAEAAKGVKLHYTVVVKKDVPGVIPQRQTSASLEDPTGLQPLPRIHGNGQLYAILDVGLGPPTPPKAKTIKKGEYKRTVEWDGSNWTGPSDFGNPKGKPFPRGTYKFEVSMIGRQQTAEGLRPYKIVKDVKVVITK
jgi:hypothetical protein